MNGDLCEVRIATYNRPELLSRAVGSLINQSHTNWKAVVFDDSTNTDAEKLIKGINDSRITYRKNRRNLGATNNLNQCFETKAYLGANYAFVLEDDNYLCPSFISNNIHALKSKGVNIALRNQFLEHYSLREIVKLPGTTRGDWMEEKIYEPIELHAYLLFMEGISNGGLFWKTNAESDLVVSCTKDVGLQENFRTLQIKEPIIFLKEPQAVFSLMDKDLTARKNNTNRTYSRGRQEIARQVMNKYGKEVIPFAKRIAMSKEMNLAFENSLLSAFYFRYSFTMPLNKLAKNFVKSAVRYTLYPLR